MVPPWSATRRPTARLWRPDPQVVCVPRRAALTDDVEFHTLLLLLVGGKRIGALVACWSFRVANLAGFFGGNSTQVLGRQRRQH